MSETFFGHRTTVTGHGFMLSQTWEEDHFELRLYFHDSAGSQLLLSLDEARELAATLNQWCDHEERQRRVRLKPE